MDYSFPNRLFIYRVFIVLRLDLTNSYPSRTLHVLFCHVLCQCPPHARVCLMDFIAAAVTGA